MTPAAAPTVWMPLKVPSRSETYVPVMTMNSPMKPLVPGHADRGERDDEEERRVDRHHLREAAELVDLARVAAVVDDADEEEERARSTTACTAWSSSLIAPAWRLDRVVPRRHASFAPSVTIARASTVVAVVPCPRRTEVFNDTSFTICAPMSRTCPPSSISLTPPSPVFGHGRRSHSALLHHHVVRRPQRHRHRVRQVN